MVSKAAAERKNRPLLSLATAVENPVMAVFVLLAVVRLPYLLLRALLNRRRSASLARRASLLTADGQARSKVVGLFHPFCNAGGGGERVVWTAVSYMQQTSPDLAFVVYTGDYPAASKEAIVDRARHHFNIALAPETIFLVPLASRRLISDSYWRRLTLLGQAVGAVVCAWEALAGPHGVVPNVFIDTMGYAWAYPFVRFFAGADLPIGAYVHYPTISPDMVSRVRNRQHTHTNAAAARSPIRSALKLVYYRILIRTYAWCLSFGEEIMANSSWTKAHLDTLLGSARAADDGAGAGARERVSKVFPPCETGDLGKLALGEDKRERVVLSLAQFRPEKDHPAQLRALAELFTLRPDWQQPGKDQVRLVMVGSVRDEADAGRVAGLRALAAELGITDNVEIVVNADYPTLLAWLGRASVGLSTMVDEHFGINVVEFMAAGLIPLAHASAGPWLDIVLPSPLPSPPYSPSLASPPALANRTGYHALSPLGFSRALVEIFELPRGEREGVRERARESVEDRFGRGAFERGWEESLGRLMGGLQG